MRILIPTSNSYVWVCNVSLNLLDKYWPTHPFVDVAHFECRPGFSGPRFPNYDLRYLNYGKQSEMKWADQILQYLKRDCRGNSVLIMNDDYGLFAPVDDRNIAIGHQFISDNPNVVNYCLSWHPVRHRPQPHEPERTDEPHSIIFKPWDYSVSMQAGIWNRKLMIRLLEGCKEKAQNRDFEFAGTDYFNRVMYPDGYRMAGWDVPDPPVIELFTDRASNKGDWPLPYHNLCRSGQLDQAHIEFLRQEGFL